MASRCRGFRDGLRQADPEVRDGSELLRLSLGKVMSGLQVEPKLGRRSERRGEEPSGFRGHPALALDDFVDPWIGI